MLTIDTREYLDSLKRFGVDEARIEDIVTNLKKVQNIHLQALTTKESLSGFEEEIIRFKDESRAFESRTIKQLGLIKWMVALLIFVSCFPALKVLAVF